jgi:hypothetical protein
MAASDHLSAAQFRPIEEIGAMPSQYGNMTVEQAYQGPERYDEMEQEYARNKGYNSAQEYQAALRDHVAEHGIKNPLVYGSGGLGNGHHRYFAARDLGMTHIPAEPWGPKSKIQDVPGWDK